MTVATRAQRADAAVASEPLALLSQASLTIEEQPERFMTLVRSATVEQLRPFAPRLLELLHVPTFGLERLDGVTPREVAVQAVLRVGYPFALQLEPDDVAFVREQSAANRRTRRRALLRRLLPAAVAFVGLAFAVNGFLRIGAARTTENPVRGEVRSVTLSAPGHRSDPKPWTSTSEVDLPLPELAMLVPEAEHSELLEASMEELVARGHHTEALVVGLDCLALSGVDERPCVMGLLSAVTGLARAQGGLPALDRDEDLPRGAIRRPGLQAGALESRELSDALFLFSEAPRAISVRRSTRKVVASLRLLAENGPALTGTSSAMARDAQARFARGEFAAALDLAERCVASFPADLECLSVATAALPLVNAARAPADRKARERSVTEFFERYRRQMARVLAHSARERCEAQPAGTNESRPIACP